MQQQQRRLFGITGLAIEDLDIANGNGPIRVTGSAAIDSEKLPSRVIAARAAAKNARRIGRSLVGGWRMVAQSPNLRSIFSHRDNHLLFGYIISKFGRIRLSRISDLQAFVAVVEKASLTSAAHQLGRSLQSVSRSLAAIEQDVGVELIRRTTRRSNPTEAGLAYYQRLKTALEDIEEAKLQVSHRRLEPSGLLRISGPTGFAALHLVPATAAFLELHPKIEVEVSTYDRYVDLVEDNLDLAVHIGPLPNFVAKSKRLADLRRVFFAAPGYFAKHGRPKTSGRSFKASMHRAHGAGRRGYLAVHGGRQGQDDQGNRALSRQWRQRHQRGGNSWPGNCHRAAVACPAIDRSRTGRSDARPICAAANSSSRHLVGHAGATGENADVHRFPEPAAQGGASVAKSRTHPIVSATRPIALRSINSRIALA